MQPPITLKVTNTSTFVEGSLPSGMYQQFKKELSFFPENASFIIHQKKMDPKAKPWEKNWDGRVSVVCYSYDKCRCPIKKAGTHFPTGLLSKAKEFFTAYGLPFVVKDQRIKAAASGLDLKVNPAECEPRDYQIDTTDKGIKQQRGIVQMATGGGKTATAAQFVARLGVSPFIFFVPSIDLLKQAQDELSRFILQGNSQLKVGAIGGGVCDIRDINVMTIQTAVRALGGVFEDFDDEEELTIEKEDKPETKARYEEIRNLIQTCKGMICDEVQHWAAKTCQIIADNSTSCQYKYGFSATPWRDKGDDLLIDACFGKIISKISASFLIERKFLVPPDIFFVPVKNSKGMGGFQYAKIYKQAISENSLRNTYITNLANQFQQEARTTLILCQHIAHGKMLNKLIPNSVFLYGEHSGNEREHHLDLMRAKKAPVTIATSIFDEGIDCRPLDTLILAGAGKSQTRALQRVGRVLRPFAGKERATVIDFADDCKYMRDHSKKRKKIYETEPLFNIDVLTL